MYFYNSMISNLNNNISPRSTNVVFFSLTNEIMINQKYLKKALHVYMIIVI